MTDTKEPFAPKFFFILGMIGVGVLIYHLVPKFPYYILSASQRPLHPMHEVLRSSGRSGLLFGIIGTLLILLNLSYLIRKRWIAVEWVGSLRSWMAFHVFTGLVAGILVLMHSALLIRSALGLLALGAILVVVCTGLVGRYIYSRTPRSLEGRELELDEIRRRLEAYQAGLSKLGVPAEFFKQSLAPTLVQGTDHGLWQALWGLISGDRALRKEYKHLRQLIHATPQLRPLAREVLPLALRFIRERQWMVRYNEMRSVMSGWRFLHRWMAILLIVAVLFHVYIAIRMGNLWIFDFIR